MIEVLVARVVRSMQGVIRDLSLQVGWDGGIGDYLHKLESGQGFTGGPPASGQRMGLLG